jgi:hypothetical protein
VIDQYLWNAYRQGERKFVSGRRWGTGRVEITSVRLLGVEDDLGCDTLVTGDCFVVELEYLAHDDIARPVFGIAIYSDKGVHVTGPNTAVQGYVVPPLSAGDTGLVRYEVPSLPLLAGAYRLSISAHDRAETEMFDYHDQMYPFYVSPGGLRESHGVVTLNGCWHLS